VSAGSAWFTLLGFLGLYMLLGILFLFLVYREIDAGPESANAHDLHTEEGNRHAA
jgi:cytochrome d ubiquinol oxidase subunit I